MAHIVSTSGSWIAKPGPLAPNSGMTVRMIAATAASSRGSMGRRTGGWSGAGLLEATQRSCQATGATARGASPAAGSGTDRVTEDSAGFLVEDPDSLPSAPQAGRVALPGDVGEHRVPHPTGRDVHFPELAHQASRTCVPSKARLPLPAPPAASNVATGAPSAAKTCSRSRAITASSPPGATAAARTLPSQRRSGDPRRANDFAVAAEATAGPSARSPSGTTCPAGELGPTLVAAEPRAVRREGDADLSEETEQAEPGVDLAVIRQRDAGHVRALGQVVGRRHAHGHARPVTSKTWMACVRWSASATRPRASR